MVGAFILTRTFAISALFVGTYDLVYAAPISGSGVAFEDTDHGVAEARNCRNGGCLRSVPVELVDFPDVPVVRGAEPEPRSILDYVVGRLESPSDDAILTPNPDEASAIAEETRPAVVVENREPAPAPRPDDTNVGIP
ncbi:hypothetical protein FOMPIDRAFT_88323 [Fomitopsis schrenkii]|uniref:Uncharacterized protein n=1 Tax=Fomitopsis schrenkii TaxID=2126942 RepID=S8FPY7_FOMSC|nr:hypothetical protein FOMPIDRAFT_88323 [Fomitopsis schrenkii]